jgi:methyl-accepting chemotaxis protein
MTTRHKFLLIFFIFVSLVIMLAKVFESHSLQMTLLKDAISHSYKLNADVLLLRKNEKNFLTRLSWDELKKFETNATLILHDTDYLKLLLGDDDPEVSAALLKIHDSLIQYKNNFEIVCDRYEKIGIDYDHGLRGKVKQAFLKIESFLWNLNNYEPSARTRIQDYQYALMKLSVTEKNFFLKPSLKYVERFKTYLQNFLDELQEDIFLPHADRQVFYDLITDYSENFIQLTEMMIDLNHSPNSPLIRLSHAAHEVENLVHQVSAEIVDDLITSERGARTYSMLIMLCFAFGILSIAVIPFLLLMFGQNQPMLLLDERS